MIDAKLQALTAEANAAWDRYWQQLERVYGPENANARHWEASAPGAALHGLQHTDPELIAAYEEQQTAKVRAFFRRDQLERETAQEEEMIMAEDTTYNGWTNWDTWNTYNWLTSDYDTTKHLERIAPRLTVEGFTAEAGDALNAISNPDEIDFDKINWQEVYNAFTEE